MSLKSSPEEHSGLTPQGSMRHAAWRSHWLVAQLVGVSQKTLLSPWLASPPPGTRTRYGEVRAHPKWPLCWSPCPTAQLGWASGGPPRAEGRGAQGRRCSRGSRLWGQQFVTGSIDFCSPGSAAGLGGDSGGPYPARCTFSRPSSQTFWHAWPVNQPYHRAWPSAAGWEGSRWPVQVLPSCSPSRHSQRKTLEVIVLFSSSEGIQRGSR